jgi:hypothetical protein
MKEAFNLPERGEIEILLLIGQSKNEDTFKETPIDRLKSRLEILLKLDAKPGESAGVRVELVEFFSKFRQLYLKAAARFPKLTIRLFYACKGDTPGKDSKQCALTESTCNLLRERFTKTPITFELIGARELLELARTMPSESFTLKLSESPVSSSREPGYVGLVKLTDFYRFITDEKGRLGKMTIEMY